MIVSPFQLEERMAWRRDDLLREAVAERLAAQIRRPSTGARWRLAAALYALAARLDPTCVASSVYAEA
jgi:hypothetical protein